VRTADHFEIRSQYLISTTGVLSVPQYPAVPGREDFEGEAYHPGLWPKETVDFTGKRVAIVGTGSSGVQIAPMIADDAESVTIFQRTPSWCTPLNNHPISPEQQAYLKANFESIRDELNASIAGFLHKAHDRATFDDSKEERWRSARQPGSRQADSEKRCEWCAFKKDASSVGDGGEADPQVINAVRPPTVLRDVQQADVSLVSLPDRWSRSLKQDRDHRQPAQFDMIVWATG
jgi:cation diffusion facilitator CzcD-associated flavoprotein CzcO